MFSSPWNYLVIIELMSCSFICSILLTALFWGLQREKRRVFGINYVYFFFLTIFYYSKVVLAVYVFNCPFISHLPVFLELFMMAYRFAKSCMVSISCLWLIDLWHIISRLNEIQNLPFGPEKEAMVLSERRKRQRRVTIFTHLGLILACLITACQYSFGNCSIEVQLAIERNREFISPRKQAQSLHLLIIECIPELIFVTITFFSLPYWNYQMKKSIVFSDAFISSYSTLKCDLVFLYFAAVCSIFSMTNLISSKVCFLPSKETLYSFVPHWGYVEKQIFSCGHGIFALALYVFGSQDAKVSAERSFLAISWNFYLLVLLGIFAKELLFGI